MAATARPRILPYGDGAILATFGDRIDVALSRRIGRLVTALDARIAAGELPGAIDLVPSYTTLTAIFDPRATDGKTIATTIRALWDEPGHAPEAGVGRTIEIPVHYGGEHGPDLAAVAAHTGLTPDAVIARHAAGRYVVGALGFSPGFAFLIGLDPALATPRRATPRTAVPVGSVGIGGGQTGVYAQATPGGWSLIGRTPLRLARMEDPDPARAFLMQGGDSVRFVPIDAARFAELAAEGAGSVREAPATAAFDPAGGAFAVIAPGLQTTVQDLGRPGMGRYGISPGGAADRASLVAANRAVGNPDGAAALEITLTGPTLRAMRPLRIAVAGADLGATVNGFPLTSGHPYDLRAGDLVAFDPAIPGRGLRAYLAVAGGIDVPLVMGSRATDLTAGMGGLDGRALQAGDLLRRGTARAGGLSGPVSLPGMPRDALVLRVVRGPHADRFDQAAWDAFLGAGFTVSSQSNRMGLRLEGPSLSAAGGSDLISEGMVTGAIQVTSGGQPIVMLPARATIGGYATIATVITADLDQLGQARPGTTVRFREVSVAEAVAVAVATASARGEWPDGRPGPLGMDPAERAAVMAMVRDFPGSGLDSLTVEVPASRLSLHLRR